LKKKHDKQEQGKILTECAYINIPTQFKGNKERWKGGAFVLTKQSSDPQKATRKDCLQIQSQS